MARTIVTDISKDELAKLKAGRNFFLLFTRVPPIEGQQLILQCPEMDEEFVTTVEMIVSEPGLKQNWFLLAWGVSVIQP